MAPQGIRRGKRKEHCSEGCRLKAWRARHPRIEAEALARLLGLEARVRRAAVWLRLRQRELLRRFREFGDPADELAAEELREGTDVLVEVLRRRKGVKVEGQQMTLEDAVRRTLEAVPEPAPHTLVRRTDPATSEAAAYSAGGLRRAHKRRILEALLVHGPRTSEELAELAGLSHWAVTKRVPELRRQGLVEASGEERRNRSGRRASVWAATATARGRG